MSDTVGVLWRAGSGTVDPWTKNIIVTCEQQSLVKAGSNACGAATQAQEDACATLKTTPGGSSDPSAFWCGLKKSISSGFDLTNNLGKTVLFVGIGALLVWFAFNHFMKGE